MRWWEAIQTWAKTQQAEVERATRGWGDYYTRVGRGVRVVYGGFRFLCFTAYTIGFFVILCLLWTPLRVTRGRAAADRAMEATLLRWWGWVNMRFLFRSRVRIIGAMPPMGEKWIVVSNHTGYVDIMACTQLGRVAFMSRHEVRLVPIIGWACYMCGMLFVNRRDKASRMRNRELLCRRYDEGIHIVLFSEGTSTDGRDVGPFRLSAFEQGLDIVPCAVKFRTSTGFNPAWYGDLKFGPHLMELLAQPGGIETRLRVFPRMRSADYPDPQSYLNAVRTCIRNWVTTPWGEEDEESRAAS